MILYMMRRYLVRLSNIAIAKRAGKKAKERLWSKGYPIVIGIDKEVYYQYKNGKIERIENELKKTKTKQ